MFRHTLKTAALLAGGLGILSLPAREAGAVTLSYLEQNGLSLSYGGVTFSGFDNMLPYSAAANIDVYIISSDPNYVGLVFAPTAPASNNPWATNTTNCQASGPGVCPASPTDEVFYTVTSSKGPISSVFSFTGFSQNFGGDSFYNDGTVTVNKTSPSVLNIVNNCDSINPLSCGGQVAAGYQNLALGQTADLMDTISLQYNGSPASQGYRIGVTAMVQEFGLNGVTVLADSSGPAGYVFLSDGQSVGFSVPEPMTLTIFGTGMAGLLAARRRRIPMEA